MNKNSSSGIVLILLATILLSIRSILVKLAYAENILVMDLFYYRFLFTVPLLWIFASITQRQKFYKKIYNKEIAIPCILAGLFGYYLATLVDLYSLKLIDANIQSIIVYTFPIYVLIWHSIIKKELPSKLDIISFSLVQVALYFVLGGFNLSLLEANKSGALFAFLTAISYSIYIIINQQTGKKIGSILFTTYAITFSFLFINIHFFTLHQPNSFFMISGKGQAIIVIMSIFCTFLPLLFIAEGIKHIGASRFALLNTSGPIITITLAYLILDETMSIQQILGSILIMAILYASEMIKIRKSKYNKI